jgi:hypothetical protein
MADRANSPTPSRAEPGAGAPHEPSRPPGTPARAAGGNDTLTYLVVLVPAVAVGLALLFSGPTAPSGVMVGPADRTLAPTATELARPEPAKRERPLAGRALEVKHAASYTYLRLDTRDEGEVWAAVNQSSIAVGDTVEVRDAFLMERFESKALRRTFDRIWFGMVPGAPSTSGAGPSPSALALPPASAQAAASATGALPPGAELTLASVLGQGRALAGRTVRVRGVVTKVNEGILDRNWVHLGEPASTTTKEGAPLDLLVTTSEAPKVGDEVIAEGVVAVDRDFGAGYAYALLLETGRFSPAPAKR